MARGCEKPLPFLILDKLRGLKYYDNENSQLNGMDNGYI